MPALSPGPFDRQPGSGLIEALLLNQCVYFVRQWRHVADAAYPLIDIACNGLLAEADLYRAVRLRLQQQIAFPIPLDAHR